MSTAPFHRPPTLKEVARGLGLSAASVSLALNGRGKAVGLADATVERILRHARLVGYVPDPRARSLRLRRSDVVGVVFPHLRNDWAHEILEGMHELLEERRLVPFLANHRGDPRREAAEIASLVQRQAAGIVCSPLERSLPTYRHVLAQRIPLVFFGDALDALPEASHAAWDPAAVRTSVGHLLDVGCRRIAFLGAADSRQMARRRLETYLQTLADAGCPARPEWILLPRRPETRAARLRALFRRRRPPDALFVLYNDAAIEAVDVLRAHGLRVPEDVRVATLADNPLCGPRAYDLTVVSAPVREEGRAAARILLDLLDRPDSPPIHRRVPGGHLLARGSTRPRAGAAPLTAIG